MPRGSSGFPVFKLFMKNVFIFHFLIDKIHSYFVFDIIVHFIIKKLKNKHIFLKKCINWESWGTSRQENLAFSVCILFKECVFIFQYLNDKMHNYVKQNIIVHFIIQKLKSKHTFLKKYKKLRELNPLNLTEQEETKPDISHLG